MKHTYSPKEFGKLIGKSVNTLQKWDRKGILPAHRSLTNRRYYSHDQYLEYRGLKSTERGKPMAYARVSGPAQKPDLVHQKAALQAFCDAAHIRVDEWMQDIGSGLNYKRQAFNDLLEEVELGRVRRIVIAHRDRLVCFGYGWFEVFCKRHNTQIVVIDGEQMSPEQELVQDLMAIITVFATRLPAFPSYKKAITNAALQKDQNRGQ